MTLALTLADSDSVWLEEFSRGFFEAADEYQLVLVGGDTTRGSETVVSVHVIGDVEPDKAMTRAGAKPGDAIYVSGTVGDAAAGLSILQSGLPNSDDVDYLLNRFRRPQARIVLGAALSTVAHAAIDLSDGLYTDLEKLLAASGVAGKFELSDIPLSPQLTNLMDEEDALRFALSGGDDYELCFTAGAADDQMREITSSSGVPITRIGQATAGSGLRCTRNGDPYHYQDAGYRHFQ